MTRPSRPAPDSGAIAFAEKLLSLLDRGQFTSTYKYAVLLGLMDLCLEYSTRTGAAPTSLTTRQLAEKVLQLYWPHAVPFVGESAKILRQNASERGGGQAAIVRKIVAFRAGHGLDPDSSMARARARDRKRFETLVGFVEWKLVEMPLPRLQFIDQAEEPFIYRIYWDKNILKREFNDEHNFDNSIRLIGSAGDHLVRLAGLLRPLIQREWAAKVARLNEDVIPDAALERFLFGADRSALTPVRQPIRDLQDNRCFYCETRLGPNVVVDHFVPWARYPNNAIENLVVADSKCNSHKRDHLAAVTHVERWIERSRRHALDLEDIATRAVWDSQPVRSLGVARAIYLRLPAGMQLWRQKDHFEPVDRSALRTALARSIRPGSR